MSSRHRPSRPASNTGDEGAAESHQKGERLQKVLAAAGVASRRECEELIVTGRVEVDKKTVTELGTRVDPVRQEIRVDGVALHQPKRVYYLLNKPAGVVCTNYDPSGRERVIDLIKTDERIFPVGRLDRSSEGLILVTNDGTLANRLTHPRYGVEKTYLVMTEGHPSLATLEKLRRGIHLAEGFAKVAYISLKRKHPTTTEMIIVLNEGRNREIRRILARVGHKVLRLKRIAIGPIKIAGLPTGAYRKLMHPEVQMLDKAVSQARKAAKKKRTKPNPTAGASHDTAAAPRPPKPTSQKPPRTPLTFQRSDDDDDDDFDGDDDFVSMSDDEMSSQFSDFDTNFEFTERPGTVLGDDDDDVGFQSGRGKRRRQRDAESPSDPFTAERAERRPAKKPFNKKAPFGKRGAGRKPFRAGAGPSGAPTGDRGESSGESSGRDRAARPSKKPFGKKPFGKRSGGSGGGRGSSGGGGGASLGRRKPYGKKKSWKKSK